MDTKLIDDAREFLKHGCPTGDRETRRRLDAYEGDLDAVIREVKPKPLPHPPMGWQVNQPFKKPELAAKHPGELLTYYAPPDYSPDRSLGLVLFMHGGGHSTLRNSNAKVYEKYGIHDLFEASGRVVCFPCAPFSRNSFAGWNQACVDEYLADVIEEMEYHFAIDPHDMILGGHSMGGLGAYHLAQRLSDRFASVLASAGAWDFAYWPSAIGTTVWLVQGINDAWLYRRRHGTDIEFARLARKRLLESGVDLVYREHAGCHHPKDMRPFLHEWLQWSRGRRRDPFHPIVVAATPRGCTPWQDMFRHPIPLAAAQNHVDFHEIPPAPHARWITIDDTTDDAIMFDMTEMTPHTIRDEFEEDWNAYELRLRRKHIPGAVVQAVRRADGVIEITPVNVKKLTVWLHGAMTDLKNVKIVIKGTVRHDGPVKPSLATLLESYLRRRDWGLLYPVKLTFDSEESWFEGDQLRLTVKR